MKIPRQISSVNSPKINFAGAKQAKKLNMKSFGAVRQKLVEEGICHTLTKSFSRQSTLEKRTTPLELIFRVIGGVCESLSRPG
jgi:hypothetical protein